MRVLALLPIAALMLGCGGPGPRSSSGSSRPSPVDTMLITVSDTVGVEYGDSTQTFGMLMDAEWTPDGDIAVLDLYRCSVQIFSPEGEELHRLGGRGAGPGEFQAPISMAVLPGGGIAANDLVGGKLVFFGGDLEVTEEVTGYFPSPPERIEGFDDSTVVALFFRITIGEEGAEGSIQLARFGFQAEPEIVYEELPMSLDMNMGEPGSEADPRFEFCCDAAGGVVYMSELSDSMLLVRAFDRDGREISRFREDFDRRRIPEDERGEVAAIMLMVGQDGAVADTRFQPDPAEFRTVVRDIGLDASGNLWLQMEHTGDTHFRVYSPAGDLLSVAFPEHPATLDDCEYTITPYGMLAFEPNPDDWPKVYLLETIGP